MIRSAGREQSKNADFLSRSGSVNRTGAAKVLVSTGGCFDLRGLLGGHGRTGFETTVGSRMVGFRSLSCRVFKMGFNSIAILGFSLILDLTRFTTHFSIDRDFDLGFSCASSTHLRSRNACNIEGIQTVYSASILKKTSANNVFKKTFKQSKTNTPS